jgi:hypothetical protein
MHGCFAADAAGLNPFPFHVVSVALHALVSMMVLGLAQHLFAQLELVTATTAAPEPTAATAGRGRQPSSKPSSAASASARKVPGSWLHFADWSALWLQPCSRQRQWQAVLAALLFALHPVHTEVSRSLASTIMFKTFLGQAAADWAPCQISSPVM